MAVSSGLQKYFDSQRKKKGDMDDKLTALASQIDPAFMQSFIGFHDRILDIVEENPELEDSIEEEIMELDKNLQNSKRKHNLKKAATIVKATENS